MATPRVALIKPSQIHHVTKPLPESALKELKTEIVNLMKEDKKARYLLGQKLDILNKERARGRSGTFMADLREMRINYHKALRLIKFYRRAQSYFAIKNEQDVNMAAKWGVEIQDANDFERALQSEEADKRLAAINVLADMEREKVRQAQASRANGKAPIYKVGLVLSDTQKERFKKAWTSLEEDKRSSIVFKAIIDAAK